MSWPYHQTSQLVSVFPSYPSFLVLCYTTRSSDWSSSLCYSPSAWLPTLPDLEIVPTGTAWPHLYARTCSCTQPCSRALSKRIAVCSICPVWVALAWSVYSSSLVAISTVSTDPARSYSCLSSFFGGLSLSRVISVLGQFSIVPLEPDWLWFLAQSIFYLRFKHHISQLVGVDDDGSLPWSGYYSRDLSILLCLGRVEVIAIENMIAGLRNVHYLPSLGCFLNISNQ